MKNTYTINKNDELKRFEFDPKDKGDAYFIDFREVNENEDDAWFVLTHELKKFYKSEDNMTW